MCFLFNSFNCHCYLNSISELDKVTWVCNPCTFKEKAEESEVQGHALHRKFNTCITKQKI